MAKTYKISELLSHAVQPLDDLPQEMITVMATDMGKGPLAVKIVLSSEGKVIDGSQRLKALQKAGRKTISEDDVIIRSDIDSTNEEDWALKLNLARRHLTLDQKKDLAHSANVKLGWSQHRIAKAFGVTQASISGWLKEREKPAAVVGLDGVAQTTGGKSVVTPKAAPQPWSDSGVLMRRVWALTAALRQDENKLRRIGTVNFDQVLRDLQELDHVLTIFIGDAAGSPAVPSKRPAKAASRSAQRA